MYTDGEVEDGEIDEEERVDDEDAYGCNCVAYLEPLMVGQEGFSVEEFLVWVFFVQVCYSRVWELGLVSNKV